MPVVDRTDAEIVRELQWAPTEEGRQSLAWKEWLVTNGLGGYASGTVSGSLTRRFHGMLVSALPNPFGRTMMLNYLWERLRLSDGRTISVPRVIDTPGGKELDSSHYLVAFRLEAGLPVWEYEVEGVRFERRVLMPHLQNTTHVSYRLLSNEPVRLELRPVVGFRLHEAPVNHPLTAPYASARWAIGSRSRRAATCRRCACPSTARTRRSPSRLTRSSTPSTRSRSTGATSAAATCGPRGTSA